MKLSKYGFNVALVLLLVPGIARAENPDLMTLIGASGEADTYAARDNNGEDTNDNASTYGLSSSDHNSFAVDYGNSGIVRGHGRCSTRAGDSGTWNNDTYNVISGNFVDSLTDETGQSGAQYCYCQLDSYTASGGSAQALSGPWVFRSDDEDADTCADDCALDCADADKPYIMCHEAAHRLAIASEQEANFAAFLACDASNDVRFRYSGYYNAAGYCLNALYRYDPERTQELLQEFADGDGREGLLLFLSDRAATSAYYDSYEGAFEEVGQKVNDTYLKSFGESTGVRSYGLVVDYLIAWGRTTSQSE